MKRIIIFFALVHAATSMENEGGLLSKLPRDLFNHTCSFLDHKSVSVLGTTSKKNEGRIKNYKEHVIQKLYNDINLQDTMKNQGAYTLIHWEALVKGNILLFERYTAPKEEKTHILIGLLQLCWEKKLEKLEFLLREKLKEEEHNASISNVLKEHLKTILLSNYGSNIVQNTSETPNKRYEILRIQKSSPRDKLKLCSDITFEIDGPNDEYFNALMFALPFSTSFNAVNEVAKEFLCRFYEIHPQYTAPFRAIRTRLYEVIPQYFMQTLCNFHIKKNHYLSAESFFQILINKQCINKDAYNTYISSFKHQIFTHIVQLNNFTELLPFYFQCPHIIRNIFIKKPVFLWKENESKEIKKEDTPLIKEMTFASLFICKKNFTLAEQLIDKVKNVIPYIQWTEQENKILLTEIFTKRGYSTIKKPTYSNEKKEKIRVYELLNVSIVRAILQSKLEGIEYIVKCILDDNIRDPNLSHLYSDVDVNFDLIKVLSEKITNIEFFAEILKYNRVKQNKDFYTYILEYIKKQFPEKDALNLKRILESDQQEEVTRKKHQTEFERSFDHI